MITLFIENAEPKRALLIMDQADVLECKISGPHSLNYTAGTFSGEIRVQNLPFEKLKIDVPALMKDLDFKDLKHAKSVMDKLHSALPEIEVTSKAINEIVEGDDGLTKQEDGSLEVTNAEKAFKDSVQSNKQQQQNKNKFQNKNQQKGKDKHKPVVVKDPSKLKEAIHNQNQKTDHNEQKADNVKKDQKGKDFKEPKWDGATEVATMEHFAKGFGIGKPFKNHKEEIEVTLVAAPRIPSTDPGPRPALIFAKEETAKFTLDALIKHPSFSKYVSACDIYPLANLKPKLLDTRALLITDPKSFVNHIAKIVRKDGK
jgi:hypothetical protein